MVSLTNKKFFLLGSFVVLLLSIFAFGHQASALDCMADAKSKYGSGFVDMHYEVFNTRCSGIGYDGRYGTAVPEYEEYPEWTRLPGDTLSFTIRRIIYSAKVDSVSSDGGCIESNDSNVSITGTTTKLLTLKSGTKRTYISSDKDVIFLDGASIKNSWSNWSAGGTATVTINSSALSASVGDSSGLVSTGFSYTTYLVCHDDRANNNTMYYKFYKITNIEHGSAKATYSGTDYNSTSTSQSSPITVSDGSITFTHQLKRNDGWTAPSSASLSDVYKRKITSGSTTASEDSSWKNITLASGGTYANVTDSIAISSLNLSPNVATQVCSTVTHRKVKGFYGHQAKNDSTTNVDTSTICIWVKDDRIMVEPGSRSYVHNSIESKTVTHTEGSGTLSSMGGSRAATKKFTFSFTHQLKLQGLAGYAYDIDYYVERSTNGGASYSAVTGGGSASSPNRASSVYPSIGGIPSGNDAYYTVMTNNWVSDDISRGGSTPTVCERITFKPKKVEIKMSTGSTTVKDASWQSSTVCTKVERRRPKEPEISATCKVIVDGQENPTDVIYNTHANFQFQFGFNLSTSLGYTLGTNYTIKRSVDGGAYTNVNANPIYVTAPKNGISDSPLVSVEEGKSKRICETININPFKYTVHLNDNGTDDGSPEAQTGGKDAATCCATVARPKREPRDDGEIIVYSESSGKLDKENETGGYESTQDAWLMKTTSADITYTHKLWRKAEKHTGDGTHQAAVTSPAEDVTVRYRFADPATNFASTSITNAHTSVIATNTENSKYSFNSNRTDNLLNANTLARAEVVGVKNEYCQSVSYVSEKYTLRGIYWQVDGQIYTGDPSLQGTEAPVSKDIVGKSVKGCVNVVRPYNFKIDSIEPSAKTKTSSTIPANAGQEIEAEYTINVGKNDQNYMITDIPQSDVKHISFVLNGTPTNGALSGGKAESGTTPCTFFANKLGQTMDTATPCDDSTSSGPLSDHNGTAYYTDGSYKITHRYSTVIPKLDISKKFCLAIAVMPSSSNPNGSYGFTAPTNTIDTNYTISDATCYNVGKFPTVQVWGGSIYTSGGTDTSTTSIKEGNLNHIFGSWDDYLIIAKGKVSKTASGAALISGLTDFSDCKISPLTVSNSSCRDTDGELGHSNIEIVDRVMSGIKTRYIDGTGKYATLSKVGDGGAYVVDRSVVSEALSYYPILLYNSDSSKNVYITQDVDTGFTTRAYKTFAIPQVIIYTTGNIYIDPSVKRVDAWLLAGGEIKTCANGSGTNIRTTADSDRCDNGLRITGPIVASKVSFDRTYGGDNAKDTVKEPAEIVDLNPGAYLFGANEATDHAQPITTYIHELPPRY